MEILLFQYSITCFKSILNSFMLALKNLIGTILTKSISTCSVSRYATSRIFVQIHLHLSYFGIIFVYCGQICESLTSGPSHAIDITREVGIGACAVQA